MDSREELLDRIQQLEKSSKLALPFTAVGLIAVICALVYASVQLDRVQGEVRKSEEQRLASAAAVLDAERHLEELQTRLKRLTEEVAAATARGIPQPERVTALQEAAESAKSATRESTAAASVITKLATCEKIVSIRELGWRSGHKSRFCQANGYQDVHNPFGDYSAGGFCYSGSLNACMAKVFSRAK